MSAIVTDSFRIKNARDFITSVEDTNNSIYVTMGKVTPWAVESNPDTPTTAISEIVYDLWDDLFAAKRVTADQVHHVIPRYDWESGDDTYFAYNPNDHLLFTKKFHTMVDDGGDVKVYKCIVRGAGAVSEKPTHTTKDIPVAGVDGYVWKFMYEIPAKLWCAFASDEYIPVINVEDNAAAGDGGGLTPLPQGGHGANNINELGAYSVAVTCRFKYNEGGKLSVDNDFRKVAVIQNPLEFNGVAGEAETGDNYVGTVATESVLNLASVFTLSTKSGEFVADDLLDGPDGTARVVGWDEATGKLHVQILTGEFNAGDEVENDDQTASATIATIAAPGLAKDSGDTLYVEHRRPVSRNGDQTEVITVVVEF